MVVLTVETIVIVDVVVVVARNGTRSLWPVEVAMPSRVRMPVHKGTVTMQDSGTRVAHGRTVAP
jgi:hypothetical protein